MGSTGLFNSIESQPSTLTVVILDTPGLVNVSQARGDRALRTKTKFPANVFSAKRSGARKSCVMMKPVIDFFEK